MNCTLEGPQLATTFSGGQQIKFCWKSTEGKEINQIIHVYVGPGFQIVCVMGAMQ